MAERTTSFAKTVQMDTYKDDLLSVYGEVSREFNEQSSPYESSAAQTPEGESAYARDILAVYEDVANEYSEVDNKQVQQAVGTNDPSQTFIDEFEDGSKMVKESGFRYDSRPPQGMARDQDRESFDARWSEEQSRADAKQAYLEGLVSSYDDHQDLHNDRSNDQGNEFSR